MYGDVANKLVLEAKRTDHLANGSATLQLPMFQDEMVRVILKEVSQLQRNAEYLKLQEDSGKLSKCQYFVTMLCMERNKRCLLAYQKTRSEILDAIAWENNGLDTMDLLSNKGHDSGNLSPYEQEYLREYSQLISDLTAGELMDIDLAGSLTPPSDVFIDVRVLKDAGEIQTEYGVFNLIKDSQFFVRQADVERLIQQGYLQKL
ncbi:AAR188Wp [Eremothecium gossypii ATCC 10895]|uniref:DNA replication complex GINS protein PSF1 n=1 Tax=Eremothecium gossypii (strain ATCC 10895 / CBS 109.51 / FGSC 9923 / NRRL Y-1056) TaxID=284811 RepID=PSF1_EREGS|nr:AAR188Wp [Eremothecium gossypii ATCC 10895]Q75E92.1 RecName: Full=DNA replication complex GINS protein PSF1 [Eremothecium gossypii ATCC 10895]AAS50555.1 AAR188Wp [Eremothecium gossypii ATCC 10895]AEY94842.1 FAAR188Wp [Eremothecium gossypii FDAG1]